MDDVSILIKCESSPEQLEGLYIFIYFVLISFQFMNILVCINSIDS